MLENLEPRVEVFLEYKGNVVMDSTLARVLMEVERRGSLLAACRRLGLTYSKIWDKIARVERLTGIKLLRSIKGGRGGGGAVLTREAKELLDRYLKVARVGVKEERTFRPPDLMVSGSHDPLLEVMVGSIRKLNPEAEILISWVGSAGGLASLMLGDADVVGSHLLHRETGEYNIPFLDRFWLKGKVYVIRGYKREVGFVFRPETMFSDETDILRRKLKIVNRNVGSGTRIIIDSLLQQAASKLGIDEPIEKIVRGYGYQVKTHIEVARSVAQGRADVGIALRYVAKMYGLMFKTICWEWYDLIVLKERYDKKLVQALIDLLRSNEIKMKEYRMKGYKFTGESGSIIYQ